MRLRVPIGKRASIQHKLNVSGLARVKVQRTVESPRGSETTKLVFNKKDSDPEKGDQVKGAVENDPAAEALAQALEQLIAVKNKILRESTPQALVIVDEPVLPVSENLAERSDTSAAEIENRAITYEIECGDPSGRFQRSGNGPPSH